jgi:GNAT superfamily N-acetyltransferase
MTKDLPDWRFEPISEACFEPLLAIRIDVMREHLERVFRYSPERAQEFFRAAFDEPGLRLIMVDDQLAGCVAFRTRERVIQIDSFYLARRYHNGGLGTTILKALLGEADALGRPVKLGVLHGSPANRFYERHGFAKIGEDEVESYYERPLSGH